MVIGVQLFNLYLANTIKYIYKYTATMDHGKYFQYYIQGDVLYQDHINHLLLGDLLEVTVGWSIMNIQT